ncbi:hypothetical protein FOA43_004099 [Brettanomyces nanus]|uniref:Uncharacterized protein n=1 Tax=Eeniella nana TaxID=13502 RepID=A0A875S964_EENNA|nr:uncharacterized protein FOA43_004099 [Brettanomyces nanus]QPG76705.1 hypothetical protein FOA43_004099 [Brettanomyces nanus]
MFSRHRRSRQPVAYTGVNASSKNSAQPNDGAMAAAVVIGKALKQNNNNPSGLQMPPLQQANNLKRSSSMLSIRRNSLRSSRNSSITRSSSVLRNRRSMSDFNTAGNKPPEYHMVKKWVPSKHGLVAVEVPEPIVEEPPYRTQSLVSTPSRYRNFRRSASFNSKNSQLNRPVKKKSFSSLRPTGKDITLEPTIPEDKEVENEVKIEPIVQDAKDTKATIKDDTETDAKKVISMPLKRKEEDQSASGRLLSSPEFSVDGHMKSQESLVSKNTEMEVFDDYMKTSVPAVILNDDTEHTTMAQQLRPTLGITEETSMSPTPPLTSESDNLRQPVMRRSALKNSDDSKRYSNYSVSGVQGPYLSLATAENTRLNAISSSPSLNRGSSPARPQSVAALNGSPRMRTSLRPSTKNGTMSANTSAMRVSLRYSDDARQRLLQTPPTRVSMTSDHISAASKVVEQSYYNNRTVAKKSRAKSPAQIRAEFLLKKAKARPPTQLADAFDPASESYNELQRTSSWQREHLNENHPEKKVRKENRMTLRGDNSDEDMGAGVSGINPVAFKSRFADSDDEFDSPAEKTLTQPNPNWSKSLRSTSSSSTPPHHSAVQKAGSRLSRFFSEQPGNNHHHQHHEKKEEHEVQKKPKKKKFRKLRKLFGSSH